jgi:hypothetical protein
LPKNFGNEADASSSLEYDINKTADLNNFKTEQIHIVSSSNKNLGSLEKLPHSIKSYHTGRTQMENLRILYSVEGYSDTNLPRVRVSATSN